MNTVLIDAYTRKQAIEDRMLIDVTSIAKEKGFKCNVCVTAAVWSCINNIPDQFKFQDIQGRLWDILNVLYYRARGNKSPVIEFKIYMPHEITVVDQDKPDRKELVEEIKLLSLAGPGDEGELVLTIQLLNED